LLNLIISGEQEVQISRRSVLVAPLALAAPGAFLSERQSAFGAIADQAVRVAVAVPEGYRTLESRLYVIVENVSDGPQQHFEEWNSWGYDNVEIAWRADDHRTGTVRKVPGAWDRNAPTTITLQPGDSLVREVTFNPELWQGWPEMLHSTRWVVTATYRSLDDRQVGAWTGEATSPSRSVLIR
jgi:hypothetical protein